MSSVIFIVLFLVAPLLVLIEFISHCLGMGRFLVKSRPVVEILTIIVYPLIFLSTADFDKINDCCSISAFFSPAHRATLYVLITLSAAAYFYSSYRTKFSSPLLELVLNCFLLIGIAINIFCGIHMSPDDSILLWIGNVPIILLFIIVLLENHQLLMKQTEWRNKPSGFLQKMVGKLLLSNVFLRYPALLILCFPLLVLMSMILLIFGQKPDSAIKAFTDTYNHGFSQLECNVECPEGHFLCTIAASGHKGLVKPLRTGIRHGYIIRVNRQLLVSNAFEELLENKVPGLHRIIRAIYNFIGGNFRKVYDVIGNKWVSDII